MSDNGESPSTDYPLGRGYGHDYMRGGEVFGGYGYSERQEYELRRGELSPQAADDSPERGSPSPEAGGGEGASSSDDSGGVGNEPR
jgi:hypothetical protein